MVVGADNTVAPAQRGPPLALVVAKVPVAWALASRPSRSRYQHGWSSTGSLHEGPCSSTWKHAGHGCHGALGWAACVQMHALTVIRLLLCSGMSMGKLRDRTSATPSPIKVQKAYDMSHR